MLTRFEVQGFKNFESNCVFDLSQARGYDFNKACVTDGVVNKLMVYGHNNVGKSNLGLAIFDLIAHMTDKYNGQELYTHYLHANNTSGLAQFTFYFKFPSGKVEYFYSKRTRDELVAEKIIINGKVLAAIDRNNSDQATIHAKGAEHLATDFTGSRISLVAYIKNNAILADDPVNRCFTEFTSFVDQMLFFRSLGMNSYIGLEQGHRFIEQDIVAQHHVSEFQAFLEKAGIHYTLQAIEQAGQHHLFVDFNGRLLPFYDIASHGTQALALFYFWLQRIQQKDAVSFIFIDEFDAFYHHSLATHIVELLKGLSAQVVITTHNTSIMSNDLLRPDCYFLMHDKGLHSLADCSPKELREAHNIEKMYKAGAFA